MIAGESANCHSPTPAITRKLWTDAYLGAFARTAGYQMVTTDTAFEQFDGLSTVVLGRDS